MRLVNQFLFDSVLYKQQLNLWKRIKKQQTEFRKVFFQGRKYRKPKGSSYTRSLTELFEHSYRLFAQ